MIAALTTSVTEVAPLLPTWFLVVLVMVATAAGLVVLAAVLERYRVGTEGLRRRLPPAPPDEMTKDAGRPRRVAQRGPRR